MGKMITERGKQDQETRSTAELHAIKKGLQICLNNAANRKKWLCFSNLQDHNSIFC
jgi:hypothetical protein